MPPATPVTQLARLVASRATGEFIVACAEAEVHLYLQAGRIAWGTTTAERFVFRRYLLETLHVDAEALQGVFEECQRTRKPLGEALVAWQLLTPAQVRDALRAQVQVTLESLERCGAAQTLFLPRGARFAAYDPALTFELEAFGASRPPEAGAAFGQDALVALEAAVPGAPWAAVLQGRHPVHQVGAGAPPYASDLAARLGPELPLLAVRTSAGSVVGGALPERGHSVWCGLTSEGSLAAALAALEAALPEMATPLAGCVRGPFESFGETWHDTGGLLDLLERAQCPVGAAVLEGGGSGELWVTARAPMDPGALGHRAAMHQAVLDLDAFGTRQARARAAASGPAFQTALVADGRWWWFGADLLTSRPSSVWLALPRTVTHGLGWALLATLARQLSAEEAHHG